MVRPSGRRRDDDLGPVTDRTDRVEGHSVTTSSRGVRGRHSTFDLPVTPTPLAPSFHHGTGEAGVIGKEQERVRSLHIQGKVDERGDDDGDGGDDDGDSGDDDQDEGDDDGDEEQTVYVASVAPASGSDRRPRHGKGKGLTRSFMSVMSKIAGSRNKRPEVARDVPASTQKRKKVKASDWEQIGAAEAGLVDLELIPSYGGHVAGPIWRGQVFIFMLK
ncbi:hypothetical protein M9H77_19204 [Catharanthus roseus]|uniref:Uncharacterized protein n=1 Tax=Catharanthus roseus TaxID=4058 RepID=A0ACC0B9M9_CATRO|nr:hypothetical protein M9H77_19204 [Catharanthus roseus]